MKVSYCSTCKGRLWQLKRTLLPNLSALEGIDAEWIILDYNCEDNVSEILRTHPVANAAMLKGKLKVYKLTAQIPWSMPLAKNLAHSLAEGDVVVNLDIDNYIGSSFEQVKDLKDDEYLWSNPSTLINGVYGRIALTKTSFYRVGGYDLDLFGMGYDDLDLLARLNKLNYTPIKEINIPTPVVNTISDSMEHVQKVRGDISSYTINGIRSKKNLEAKKYVANMDGLINYNGTSLTPYLVRVPPTIVG